MCLIRIINKSRLTKRVWQYYLFTTCCRSVYKQSATFINGSTSSPQFKLGLMQQFKNNKPFPLVIFANCFSVFHFVHVHTRWIISLTVYVVILMPIFVFLMPEYFSALFVTHNLDTMRQIVSVYLIFLHCHILC